MCANRLAEQPRANVVEDDGSWPEPFRFDVVGIPCSDEGLRDLDCRIGANQMQVVPMPLVIERPPPDTQGDRNQCSGDEHCPDRRHALRGGCRAVAGLLRSHGHARPRFMLTSAETRRSWRGAGPATRFFAPAADDEVGPFDALHEAVVLVGDFVLPAAEPPARETRVASSAAGRVEDGVAAKERGGVAVASPGGARG